MALRASHDCHLALGDGRGMLESLARVRPMWEHDTFGYGQLLAMNAFALSEVAPTHQLSEEAEQMAIAARNLDKYDAWALHSLVRWLKELG